MILKTLSRVFLSAFIPFFILAQTSFAQDKIIQKTGISLEGNVKIFYEDNEDIILLDNERLEIDQIRRIELQFGKTLFNKRLTYYDHRKRHVVEKYVLLTPILDGEAKLYDYKGPNFDYVLELDGKLFALQALKKGTERDRTEDYRFILTANLGACVSIDKITLAEYNKNDLSELIRSYNDCKKKNLERASTPGEKISILSPTNSSGNELGISNDPEKEIGVPKVKKDIASVSVFTGLSHASHSLKSRIQSDRDVIDQENVPSDNLALGGFFQKNLFNSEKLFLELGVYYRRLNFTVRSLEKNLSVDNLAVNEISLGAGLNYKFIPSKKLSPEITIGGYAWTMGGHGNLYPETTGRFPALHSKYSSRSGRGNFFRGLLTYMYSNEVRFFVAGTYLLKSREDAFTNRVPEELKEQINDSLTDNYTITFGLTFSNPR